MRSTLVFRAHDKVSNRYELCRLASRVTRRLHFASCDTQTAINDTFVSIAGGPDYGSSLCPQSAEIIAAPIEIAATAALVQPASVFPPAIFQVEPKDSADLADTPPHWFAVRGYGRRYGASTQSAA